MSELDRLLDSVMKSKEELIINEASEEDRQELILSMREHKKQKIIDEICNEYKEELIREADMEAKKEVNRKKIEELKSLMWSGFLLAFIVGLAVNQATDMIGYYKGTVTQHDIKVTIFLTIIFCIICVAAYAYSFCKDVIALFDDLKKDKMEKH